MNLMIIKTDHGMKFKLNLLEYKFQMPANDLLLDSE